MSNTGIEWSIRQLAAVVVTSILLADCSSTSESPAAVRSFSGCCVRTLVAVRTAELQERWAVQSLAFSPDDADLAVTSPFSGEVHVWTLKAGVRLARILNQRGGGTSMACAIAQTEVFWQAHTRPMKRTGSFVSGAQEQGLLRSTLVDRALLSMPGLISPRTDCFSCVASPAGR